ncbi:MAG: peptidoglycan-binding domain-containing protein [Alphaproteobacteria bacterium]
MTQRRILQNDDVADASCQARKFKAPQVVQQPVVTRQSGYTTKSWQEDWTLERCGADYYYRVFYSEIGSGGITFSVAPISAAGLPVVEPVVAAEPEAPPLRLTTPFMRGDDVREVQVALNKAGLKVSTDGVFGPGTQKAVTTFQERRGMRADGEVGRETREALGLL